MKLAVGIPTYNEMKTIGFVATQIDQWIQSIWYRYAETVMVLLDSWSQDGTIDAFSSTPTQTPKHIIHSDKPGKWRNIINLFRYWTMHNFDHLMTFDGDVTSISPDWIVQYAMALLSWSDYVMPTYARNKYEWSATNHFAAPLVSAYSWEIVRQPLAGDFGIWKDLFSRFIDPEKEGGVHFYGIDIYLTLLAFTSAKKITEINLPKKIHKPSFPNLSIMFPQIASSALAALQWFKKHGNAIFHHDSAYVPEEFVASFLHKSAGLQMRFGALEKLIWVNLKGTFLQDYVRISDLLWWKIDSEIWTDVLNLFFKKSLWLDEDLEVLLLIYQIRVVNFWQEIEKIDDTQVEKLILEQIQLFSRKYRSRDCQ